MREKAFTLIELLVVIAIIALLLAIVTPALKMAKEHAKRMLCSNNLKNVGACVHVYATEHDGIVPPAKYKTGSGGASMTYTAFRINRSIADTGQRVLDAYKSGQANGFGYLYALRYVDSPELFYCDSAPRKIDGADDATSISFHYDSYHGDGYDWPWTRVTLHDLMVRTSYHYIPQHRTEKSDVSGQRFPVIAGKAADLGVNHVMLVDVLATLGQISHAKSGKPGVNMAKSDGSVTYANNPEAFDKDLWRMADPFLTGSEFAFRKVISLLGK